MPTFTKTQNKIHLGQHFMTANKYTRLIASQIPAKSNIVEIGAGSGMLTQELVRNARRVVAIEIDQDLKPDLNRIKQKNRQVEIAITDALSATTSKIIERESQYKNPFYIVSNLPYHITEPFIIKAATEWQKKMILTVGKKFGHIARLKNADNEFFSKLSFIARSHFFVKKITDIPKEAFSPIPATVSTLLIFEPKLWPLNLSDFLGQFIIAGKKKSKLIKNALMEGIISFNKKHKVTVTKNQARDLIAGLDINSAILEKNFDLLSNEEVKSLAVEIDKLNQTSLKAD
jgi:16S rRNA A1518/A1519 N6-dimethyltransferase RsmA/KsgA/DIM1 with predicted DNA glycosylase/AP lyase activity